jgi:RNA polymerase sigma-70 factor, ECF subfamily
LLDPRCDHAERAALRAAPSLEGNWAVAIRASLAAVARSTVSGHAAAEDAALVQRLRDGDERAFEEAVERFHRGMIAVAQGYVRSRAVAEEVVQEAWLGVLRGVKNFEGRSSLRVWVLRIVANIASAHAVREARSVPFSSLARDDEEPVVDPDRFHPAGDRYPGHWRSYPTDWRTLPEAKLLADQTLEIVQGAIEELPVTQRVVIAMRDVAGCTAREVCETLEISEGNQRVLLHRARARVRARLERHIDG